MADGLKEILKTNLKNSLALVGAFGIAFATYSYMVDPDTRNLVDKKINNALVYVDKKGQQFDNTRAGHFLDRAYGPMIFCMDHTSCYVPAEVTQKIQH